MTMNKFHFNEHKQDSWKCDWLIGHIISIKSFMNLVQMKDYMYMVTNDGKVS